MGTRTTLVGVVLLLVVTVALSPGFEGGASAATSSASCASSSVSSSTSTFTATNSSGGSALVIVNGTALQISDVSYTVIPGSGTGSPVHPIIRFDFTIAVPCGAPEVGQFKVPSTGLIPVNYTVTVSIDGTRVTPQGFVEEKNHYHVIFSMPQGTHEVSMVFSAPSTVTGSTSTSSISTSQGASTSGFTTTGEVNTGSGGMSTGTELLILFGALVVGTLALLFSSRRYGPKRRP